MTDRLLDRPLYERPYPGAWLLLVAPLVMGVSSMHSAFDASLFPPGAVGLWDNWMVNFEVYYYAGEEVLSGGELYEFHPPGRGEFYQYLYPPVTVLFFLPFQLVGLETGYWLFLGINAVTAGLLTAMIVRYVESLGRRLGWIDVVLVFAHAMVGTHLVANYAFGNVNLLLGVGVAAGIYLLEVGPRSARRESVAGSILAVVALFKVFPALIGFYLLRIRSWWSVTAAAAAGVGSLLLGEVMFAVGGLWGWSGGPRAFGFGMTEHWLRKAVLPRSDTQDFVGGYAPGDLYYVTIQRPLSHVIWGLWDGAPPWLLVVGSFAIGLAVLAPFLVRTETRLERLVAAFAAVAVAIVVMPSLRFYVALLFLPMIALAYVLEDHPVQPLFVGGAVIMAYTDPPSDVLERIQPLPDPALGALEPVVRTTSTQLLGIAVMLVALGVLARKYGNRGVPDAALEERVHGPPLREWLVARGLSLPGLTEPPEQPGGPKESWKDS